MTSSDLRHACSNSFSGKADVQPRSNSHLQGELIVEDKKDAAEDAAEEEWDDETKVLEELADDDAAWLYELPDMVTQ